MRALLYVGCEINCGYYGPGTSVEVAGIRSDGPVQNTTPDEYYYGEVHGAVTAIERTGDAITVRQGDRSMTISRDDLKVVLPRLHSLLTTQKNSGSPQCDSFYGGKVIGPGHRVTRPVTAILDGIELSAAFIPTLARFIDVGVLHKVEKAARPPKPSEPLGFLAPPAPAGCSESFVGDDFAIHRTGESIEIISDAGRVTLSKDDVVAILPVFQSASQTPPAQWKSRAVKWESKRPIGWRDLTIEPVPNTPHPAYKRERFGNRRVSITSPDGRVILPYSATKVLNRFANWGVLNVPAETPKVPEQFQARVTELIRKGLVLLRAEVARSIEGPTAELAEIDNLLKATP